MFKTFFSGDIHRKPFLKTQDQQLLKLENDHLVGWNMELLKICDFPIHKCLNIILGNLS